MITKLNRDVASLQSFLTTLKGASPEASRTLLQNLVVSDGHVSVPPVDTHPFPPRETSERGLCSDIIFQPIVNTTAPPSLCSPEHDRQQECHSSEAPQNGDVDRSLTEEADLAVFASIDETGVPQSFGPSSALNQAPTRHFSRVTNHANGAPDIHRNTLVAQAALQRQLEHRLYSLPEIEGVPTELALHLLDLHWNRAHHTFLLTYRPAIMRDLALGGKHYSRFLITAIFASTSKFSSRSLQLRDDPLDPSTAGLRFFRRCDQILAEDELLMAPSLPTVIGLLLLGSTYVARGETSKGWLYTGYALRMVFDLGLHLDPGEGDHTAEEVEIRRRVFWGAFVCDKLQSLYLGRPMMIDLCDARVSNTFLDVFEEHEIWTPFMDGKSGQLPLVAKPSPTFSVSTFQQLCRLSKVMSKIISKFYVVGVSLNDAKAHLEAIDLLLQEWLHQLPPELDFVASSVGTPNSMGYLAPPNVMHLHAIYHSLVILLHRPFISDGHLRLVTTPENSWKRCTVAARSITDVALAYCKAYTLRAAPYVLGYSLYVACTIHVRNVAVSGVDRCEHKSLLASCLECLGDLCAANTGLTRPISIIKNLMAVHEQAPQPSGTGVHSAFGTDGPNFTPDFDFDAILAMFPNDWNAGGGVAGRMGAAEPFALAKDYPISNPISNPTDKSVGGTGNNFPPQNLDFLDYNDTLYGPMGGSLTSSNQ